MIVEDSPEFQKALKEACEGQYRGYLYGGEGIKAETKSQIEGVMREVQGRRREAERMRESLALRATAMGMHMPSVPSLPDEITRESMDRYREEMGRYSTKIRVEVERQRNTHYQDITRSLRKGSGGLVCPKCGEGDHGNRVGRIPVCYMLNKHNGLGPIPLMTPEKAKDWKPPKKPAKRGSYTFKEPEGVTRTRRK